VTDEPHRCEPPADAAYDSHHWLEIDGKPMTARWDPEDRIWYPERRSTFSANSQFARSHARYLAPVPSHEDVARLVEALEYALTFHRGQFQPAWCATARTALAPFKEPTP